MKDEDPSMGLSAGDRSPFGAVMDYVGRMLGRSLYPDKVDLCNCGADLGVLIPKPQLLERAGIEKESKEWRRQTYGAALYWHLATMPGENLKKADPTWLKGKEILEVGCMRGGGARYLAEVCETKRYIATDSLQEHIQECLKLHSAFPGLRFEVADATKLAENYPGSTFDFVLAVQVDLSREGYVRFVEGAHAVLRTGGRLLLCGPVGRAKLQSILDTIESLGMVTDAQSDLSRAVHAVGFCTIPKGLSYLRIVARKVR